MDITERTVLCCSCGVAIPPNSLNMCVNCLQQRYDIGAGVAKQVQQHTCRGCDRFERRDGGWVAVEPESKELLALLLRKPRGLGSVRLADATFVWTEPHSKRIKLRVTIQNEVVAGAVLQQSFVIEYVIGNKQCPNCQRREAKDTWTAVVQVRQKVPHKRTFLWVEQLILKHSAHADTVNITELKDGLDFFFDQRCAPACTHARTHTETHTRTRHAQAHLHLLPPPAHLLPSPPTPSHRLPTPSHPRPTRSSHPSRHAARTRRSSSPSSRQSRRRAIRRPSS